MKRDRRIFAKFTILLVFITPFLTGTSLAGDFDDFKNLKLPTASSLSPRNLYQSASNTGKKIQQIAAAAPVIGPVFSAARNNVAVTARNLNEAIANTRNKISANLANFQKNNVSLSEYKGLLAAIGDPKRFQTLVSNIIVKTTHIRESKSSSSLNDSPLVSLILNADSETTKALGAITKLFVENTQRGITGSQKIVGYALENQAGINFWFEDTVNGVASFIIDTTVNTGQFAVNSAGGFLNGKWLSNPKRALDLWQCDAEKSYNNWAKDASDHIESWKIDSAKRVYEWSQDPIFGDDYVDVVMKKYDLDEFSKPEVARALHEMGMFGSEGRFNEKDFPSIIENRMRDKDDDRPLAVVLFADSEADHNGALTTLKDMFSNLNSEGYRVMYSEVTTDVEVKDTLKKFTNGGQESASLVIIGGHGNQEVVNLGQGATDEVSELLLLDLNDVTKFSDLTKKNIVKDGSVIFASCGVGKGEENEPNIVNTFSDIFRNAKRIAGPVEDISGLTLGFDHTNPSNTGVSYHISDEIYPHIWLQRPVKPYTVYRGNEK